MCMDVSGIVQFTLVVHHFVRFTRIGQFHTRLCLKLYTDYITKEHFIPRQFASNGNEGAIHF